MPKIKEVLSSEVHWQVAGWNTRDQANIRIRQLLGDEAAMFAPVYVTHGGYYWSAEDLSGWKMLTDATESERAEALGQIHGLLGSTVARFPAQKGRVEQVFAWPNDDYVFVRKVQGRMQVLVTGWGFANYNRAMGGVIVEAPQENALNEVSLALAIDGLPQAGREFEMMQGVHWTTLRTDASGHFALGRIVPGEEVRVRDTETGREFVETVGTTTTLVVLDLTKWLDVRVMATLDGIPLENEEATVDYGHRHETLRLENGSATVKLPWLGVEQCSVEVRGNVQKAALSAYSGNSFVFTLQTPRTPRLGLSVKVTSGGEPISGEVVEFEFAGTKRRGATGVDGTCRQVFEYGGDDRPTVFVSAHGIDKEFPFETGEHTLEIALDTPSGDVFDATVRVLNLDGKAVPFYPITVATGESQLELLTGDNGTVAIQGLHSGEEMVVADANDASVHQSYTLDWQDAVYDFILPFKANTNGDCLLRVLEVGGKPSVATTVLLRQGDASQMGHLDVKGEMAFDSPQFDSEKDIEVLMYSPRRTFPPLSFRLLPDEKEYEFYETDGPTPWWTRAGEIAVALAMTLGLWGMYYVWRGLLNNLPNIFA